MRYFPRAYAQLTLARHEMDIHWLFTTMVSGHWQWRVVVVNMALSILFSFLFLLFYSLFPITLLRQIDTHFQTTFLRQVCVLKT